MQQMIKQFLGIAGAVLLGLGSARAFSLAGPVNNAGDNWQQAIIGYGAPTAAVGPKNLGEGYRRNIPVMYYAYDTAFLDYFGTPGITNVDGAFEILNNTLTNGVSSYSPDLSEVPLDPQQYNYTAEALQLFDIKSLTLSLMMSQLGLANPEDNIWKLHDRYLPSGGTCPIDEEYLVIQRNFAPSPSAYTNIQYSSYVNNVLYSFDIEEVCQNSPVLADCVQFPVDTLADSYTSVAGVEEGGFQPSFGSLILGGYYTSLSADDVAGLRYLLNTNNVNFETVGGGSLLFDQSTNTTGDEVQFPANPASPTGFGTFNLASLASYAKTNPPAAVVANFPGVVIASSHNYFVQASNATVTAYFAPPPNGSVYGTLPTLAFATNYTPYLATNYVTTFANVVTNYSTNNTTAIIQTVMTTRLTGAPYPSPLVLKTNYQKVVLTNVVSGSYYFVPNFGTNLCGSGIIYTGLTNVIYVTNLLTGTSTNLLGIAPTIAGTNTTEFYSQSLITWYTNYTYVAYQVNCSQVANAAGLYQGIDKMQFIRVDYDSLLGQTFTPITNGFSMVAITNGQTMAQHFDRVVTAPDIVLDAQDLTAGNGGIPVVGTYQLTVPNFDQGNILPGLAGPGVINPITQITFDKVGNVFFNGPLAIYGLGTNAFFGLNQLSQYQVLAYGSFDGSTNQPVVYPNGSSIENLQNQLLLQISPTSLANGSRNVAYPSVQFTLTGGGGSFDLTDPFTWTTTGPAVGGPSTSGLPPGMTLSASGVLQGTPTQSGTYDFTLTFTDYYSRSVQWNYTIIIQ